MPDKKPQLPPEFKILGPGSGETVIIVVASSESGQELAHAVSDKVKALGYTVFCPRFRSFDRGDDLRVYVQRADEIVLLPGWENDPVATNCYALAYKRRMSTWFWAASIGQFIGVEAMAPNIIGK